LTWRSSRVEWIEITTSVGCPVNCSKFCPQEVTLNRYVGNRNLTLKDFKLALEGIPKNVGIFFSGFCEPFANPQAIEMIEYAHSQGYQLTLFTTLYNVDCGTVKRLIAIPFTDFCLHLPDGQVAKIPLTQDYMRNVFSVIQGIPNVSFSLMNRNFVSFNRENVVRGLATRQARRVGFCTKHEYPQFVLLPNLDVQLCCMDFGLWHKLGNLHEERYVDVRNRFLKANKNFRLCSLCDWNVSLTRHIASRLAEPVITTMKKIDR
jgi:hypothetical protein